ncbi:MAG: hypothetical protein LLG06_12175 [Desulfobacteraceae bacterium]|nr:hypothetical protein [Desulfobacteraceae bacterium]
MKYLTELNPSVNAETIAHRGICPKPSDAVCRTAGILRKSKEPLKARSGFKRAGGFVLVLGILLSMLAIDHVSGVLHAAQVRSTYAVSAGTDDVVENAITGYVTINYKSTYPGMHYLIGYRFNGIDIPPGAEIVSAVLYQYCAGYENRKTVFTYGGEASANPAEFVKERYNLSSRPLTGASVPGVPYPWVKATYNASPDLKGIVQEIVNLSGWSAGDSLCLLLDATSTSQIDHYERNASHAAYLEVVYSDAPQDSTDVDPPAVTISEPSGDCTVSQSSVNLQGTASDNVAVSAVTWETDTGASGSVVGSDQWSIAGVPLQEGTNRITVKASDAAGNVTEAVRTLSYVPSSPYSVLEGFGKDTTGGQGCKVYTASSAAQFTSVLATVKKLGGNAVINLTGNWTYASDVKFSHMSNFTLNAAESSVSFEGSTLYLIDCTNAIIQGLRIRKDQTGSDCIQVDSCERVWIDHCSVSEAGDGNIDITGYTYGASRKITVSWCILANTWKQSLVKYNGTTEISFHHNLFYNGGGRLPHFNDGIHDFRNNVIWQWGGYATTLSAGAQANIVNNYYKVSSGSSKGGSAIWYTDTASKAWISGNVLPSQEKDVSRLSAALTVPAVQTQSATAARDLVLESAGALPRDAYDQQIIDLIRSNSFPSLPPYHD